MYFKPQPTPPGANPALEEDRMPLMKVFCGDTWTVEARLVNPVTRLPATPKDTVVRFVLSENRFAEPLWTGSWHDGIEPAGAVPGLVRVTVPKSLSDRLRRGVYAFSVQVADDLGVRMETQVRGHIQVEYEPTSPTHDIPYRTDSSGEGGKDDVSEE